MTQPTGEYVLHIWQTVLDGVPSGEPRVSVHPHERITQVVETVKSNSRFFGHAIFDETTTKTLDGWLVSMAWKTRDYDNPTTTMLHFVQWDDEAWKPKPIPVKSI